MNYSKAVRTARSIADISQQELARRTSLNRSYISLIESGARNATTDTLEKIAASLEIPPHLFALLAVEEADTAEIGKEQIESLGISLAKLLLHFKDEESGREHRAVPASKPKKSTRP